MKIPAVVALALLASCATAPRGMSDTYRARIVAQYGPTCAKSYKEWSSDWQDCVIGFAQRERQQDAQARALAAPAYQPPRTINCTQTLAGTQCTQW